MGEIKMFVELIEGDCNRILMLAEAIAKVDDRPTFVNLSNRLHGEIDTLERDSAHFSEFVKGTLEPDIDLPF